MNREYRKWWSPALGRDMELLVFGDRGTPVLVFPTSMGRFYQWEDFGLVGHMAPRIEAGWLQLWCVDSVDGESFYNKTGSPQDRARRHLAYERYLIDAPAEAMEQVFKKKTVYMRSGGSIPIAGLFHDHLGIPVVMMGFGLPDDNLHAPNEKFHLPNFYGGIEAVGRYFELLGR